MLSWTSANDIKILWSHWLLLIIRTYPVAPPEPPAPSPSPWRSEAEMTRKSYHWPETHLYLIFLSWKGKICCFRLFLSCHWFNFVFFICDSKKSLLLKPLLRMVLSGSPGGSVHNPIANLDSLSKITFQKSDAWIKLQKQTKESYALIICAK